MTDWGILFVQAAVVVSIVALVFKVGYAVGWRRAMLDRAARDLYNIVGEGGGNEP